MSDHPEAPQDARTDRAAKEKVLDLIKGARTAMLTTRHRDGSMHSRPMGTNHATFDGDLWFMTSATSEKIADIEARPEVALTYCDERHHSYVSVSGDASVVHDRAKIRELWTEIARIWFPDGPDDPDIALIRVSVRWAEYWDSPGGAVKLAYGYVKSLVTGTPPKDDGENKTVRFS